MTHITTVKEEEALLKFVSDAAHYFAANPNKWTYGGEPTPGEYLALRWGLNRDCVKVIKVDAFFEPILYEQSIPAVTA